MKRFDIDKKFSEIVGLYIADGWILNTKSMTGHQGEEGKVDLVKGDELIRIWMMKDLSFKFSNKDEWHGAVMYLRVGRWNHPATYSTKHGNTVWFNDIEVFQEQKFYEVSNFKESWYVDNVEDALEAQSKKYDRYNKYLRNYQETLHEDYYREIGGKYLKNHHGYKRIKWDKVNVIKRYSEDRHHVAYYVNYNGNSYLMK